MIYFIITLISLLVGYFLGVSRGSQKSELDLIIDKLKNGITLTKKEIDRANFLATKEDNKVGAVERPTNRDLEVFKNPKIAEEEMLMTETFDNLVNANVK